MRYYPSVAVVVVVVALVGLCQCVSSSQRLYYPEVERDAYDVLHDELTTEMYLGVATNELTLIPNMEDEAQVGEWKTSMDALEMMLAYERTYHIQYGGLHICSTLAHMIRDALRQGYACTVEPVYGMREAVEQFTPNVANYAIYGITDAHLRAQFDLDLSSRGRTAVGSSYDPRYPTCASSDSSDLCHQLYDYLRTTPGPEHAPMEEAWRNLQEISVQQGAEEEAVPLEHVFICWDSESDDAARIPPMAAFVRSLPITVQYEPWMETTDEQVDE